MRVLLHSFLITLVILSIAVGAAGAGSSTASLRWAQRLLHHADFDWRFRQGFYTQPELREAEHRMKSSSRKT